MPQPRRVEKTLGDREKAQAEALIEGLINISTILKYTHWLQAADLTVLLWSDFNLCISTTDNKEHLQSVLKAYCIP